MRKQRLSSYKVLCLVMVMVAGLMLAGCTNTNSDMVEGKVNVVTSFYPLYDFAQKIGGEHVNVINLVATGVEAHDWTPKPKDMANLSKSDVFVYNGWGFEGWVEDFLEGGEAGSDLIVVEAVHGIEPILLAEDDHAHEEDTHAEEGHEEDAHAEEGHEEEAHAEEGHEEETHAEEEHEDGHDHGEYDPHVWMSPLQAVLMAENILEGLVEADPEHQADFEANFEALKQELEQLHEDYASALSDAPRKEIVVSHHAYGYLTRDYGLTQLAIMGITPDAEPTAQDIKEITEYVEEHDIRYILFEELASPKLAETLAKDVGIETLVFNPVEGLTEEQEEQGEDYISIMRTNLTTLQKALQ